MSIAVLADGELPPCQACGACCFADLPRYVRVSGDDYARLGELAEMVSAWHGNRAFLKMVDGHCAALTLDSGHGQASCSIYEQRPDTCRELERGGGACAADRAHKGQRALLAIGRAASR